MFFHAQNEIENLLTIFFSLSPSTTKESFPEKERKKEKLVKMWNQGFGKIGGDLESGAARPLYPMMVESPELRWSFIRKVYSIISFQLLATIAVGSFVVSVRPVANFFVATPVGLALYIVLIFVPFISASPQLTLSLIPSDSVA